jgi:transposase
MSCLKEAIAEAMKTLPTIYTYTGPDEVVHPEDPNLKDRISLVRNRTMLENKVHSLLDKYVYKSELADIFGKSGIIWLKTLDVSNIDRLIMNTTLAAIENTNLQIDTISKELAKYGWDSDDVKILLSITGIDVFSAMLIVVEIVDVRRFCTPWKLVSYAGLAPSTRESSGKTKTCLMAYHNKKRTEAISIVLQAIQTAFV